MGTQNPPAMTSLGFLAHPWGEKLHPERLKGGKWTGWAPPSTTILEHISQCFFCTPQTIPLLENQFPLSHPYNVFHQDTAPGPKGCTAGGRGSQGVADSSPRGLAPILPRSTPRLRWGSMFLLGELHTVTLTARHGNL